MFEFFANIFGYLLQFLYTLVNNYGLAIILFTLIIKLLLLASIKLSLLLCMIKPYIYSRIKG